jgi:RNA polymerase primary sigma factor
MGERTSQPEAIMGTGRDGDGRNGRVSNEHELVLAAKRDHGRREELVNAFLPLIGAVARPYLRQGTIDREDLMQQGVVGLLTALERYDPSVGAPFWAYASWWVRQAMQQVVSQLSSPVVLSDRALRALSRVGAARRDYVQQHRREPTRRQLAAAADLDEQHVATLFAARGRPRALEEPLGDTDTAARDLLPDPAAEDDFEAVRRRTAAQQVGELLAQLGEREQFVVRCRFGVDSEERTLRDIAGDLGLTAERVRQIEQRALESLHAIAHRSTQASTLEPEAMTPESPHVASAGGYRVGSTMPRTARAAASTS